MSQELEEGNCNCMDCFKQPNRAFRIKEGIKPEPPSFKPEMPIPRRGFFNKKAVDDVIDHKRSQEIPPSLAASSTIPRETLISKQKPLLASVPTTIEQEKPTYIEKLHEEEMIFPKCTRCIETSDTIDILNIGAFRVCCTDGCILTLHRNCFEKALGSGKKKELKTAICPTNDCYYKVTEITHRLPGRTAEFMLWLRCDVPESERPKKDEKGKEVKKKEKDKYKRDQRDEQEVRKMEMEYTNIQSTNILNSSMEEGLPLPITAINEETKKILVKPLPADLDARPIERKEDALMSKYAVKETTAKENKKKTKKEVKQVVLPGLTVKGLRGRKEDDDDHLWNDPSCQEYDANRENDIGMKYEEGPYGFAMQEDMQSDIMGIGESIDEIDMNNQHIPLDHALHVGYQGLFGLLNSNEGRSINLSSQPHDDHKGLSGFTESPIIDEPPFIENPFDYPTLESESDRKRKELINFFEAHITVIEENASLFDSPLIELESLKSMLERYIEFAYEGNDVEKWNMAESLNSIFAGEVENQIIPFIVDLRCFKYGYVDGRLVVCVKTERRERGEQIVRNENEEDNQIEGCHNAIDKEETHSKALEEQYETVSTIDMKRELEERRRKTRQNEVVSSEREEYKLESKMLERRTRDSINAFRHQKQSKSCSSDSSPERKEILKCTRSSRSSSSSITYLPLPSSSTPFSTSAPPFVPRYTNSKAELNPNAPAFISTLSTTESLIHHDENGDMDDKMWIDTHRQLHMNEISTIDQLSIRISQLEAENNSIVNGKTEKEIELSKHLEQKMIENKKYIEIINRLQSENNEKDRQILLKDKTIQLKNSDSIKKMEDIKRMEKIHGSEVEGMKFKIRETNMDLINERREKENALYMMQRGEEEKRIRIFERRTKCAKEAILMTTHIINRLACENEAQVMTSIFIDLRKKWMYFHSNLQRLLDNCRLGGEINWEATMSFKEPSMPKEANDLVKECYMWLYKTMHILSLKLASHVKKCLNDNGRYYDDIDIIGIIQKWMRIHGDPTRIDATVPQVANMVAQAMGDRPLMPPKYACVNSPAASSTLQTRSLRALQKSMTAHERRNPISVCNEPKGWKKQSDKLRQVQLEGHECCICLDHVEGGDISFCEQVSCNEPYHNDCLDQYWKTGGRICPRCRTPMPPRDAFPALG